MGYNPEMALQIAVEQDRAQTTSPRFKTNQTAGSGFELLPSLISMEDIDSSLQQYRDLGVLLVGQDFYDHSHALVPLERGEFEPLRFIDRSDVIVTIAGIACRLAFGNTEGLRRRTSRGIMALPSEVSSLSSAFTLLREFEEAIKFGDSSYYTDLSRYPHFAEPLRHFQILYEYLGGRFHRGSNETPTTMTAHVMAEGWLKALLAQAVLTCSGGNGGCSLDVDFSPSDLDRKGIDLVINRSSADGQRDVLISVKDLGVYRTEPRVKFDYVAKSRASLEVNIGRGINVSFIRAAQFLLRNQRFGECIPLVGLEKYERRQAMWIVEMAKSWSFEHYAEIERQRRLREKREMDLSRFD